MWKSFLWPLAGLIADFVIIKTGHPSIVPVILAAIAYAASCFFIARAYIKGGEGEDSQYGPLIASVVVPFVILIIAVAN